MCTTRQAGDGKDHLLNDDEHQRDDECPGRTVIVRLAATQLMLRHGEYVSLEEIQP